MRLAPLIRPLAELHWTRMVAAINHVATEEQDLHRHLFGRDRLAPPKALRDGLASLQAGCCFYCHRPFHRAPEADHFIPRVRCGIDAVENLVLADRSCNSDKRDLLPAPPLVDAWAGRNREHQATLASLAAVCGWDSDPAGTLAAARSIYRHLDGPSAVLARHRARRRHPHPPRHHHRDHLSRGSQGTARRPPKVDPCGPVPPDDPR